MAAPYDFPIYSHQQQHQEGHDNNGQPTNFGQPGYYPSNTNSYPSVVMLPPPHHQQQPQSVPPNGQQPAGTQTYIYIQNNCLGPVPTKITCPHCHQHVITKIEYKSGLMTWLLVGGCVVLGCIVGCCLIPFCMDSCKDVEHFCSNCNGYIGQYRRLS